MKGIQRTILLTAIVVMIVIVSGCSLGGCSRTAQQPTEKAQAVYGIVNMDQLMTSHPLYSKYYQLEREYNLLLAQYRAEQRNLSKKSVEQDSKLKDMSTQSGISDALNQELQSRIDLKRNELNGKLQEKYTELLKNHHAEQQLDAVKDETELRIVNLQLRLRALQLSSSEKAASENELAELMKNRHQNYAAAGTQLMSEVATEMVPYKTESEKALETYRDTVMIELQDKQKVQMESLQTTLAKGFDLPDPTIWNTEWKSRLESKEKELSDQRELIVADIKEKAAQVAADEHLEMIFSDYEANVNGVDVTDAIIAQYE